MLTHFVDWAVDWVRKYPAGASMRALTGASPSGYFAHCPTWMKVFQGN